MASSHASRPAGRDVPIRGWAQPGFEAVVEQFRRNFQERGEGGAAFAVVADGRPVVDIWAGLADAARRRPWDRDTVAVLFSGTKGLVATCLLLLVERGALDLERPVHEYWPEFADHGKDGILVRHVVSHHAGLPGLTTPVTPEEATDGAGMARLLADQPAICPPGTRLYYHAMTFGWLCGELIRRIDGRSVGRFFGDEIASPLGLDAWIGLPAEHEPRVAVLARSEGFGTQRRDEDAARGGDRLAWSVWANPPRFASDPLPANRRYWRAAEVPGSNGTASARSLARLYGCLAGGGAIDGVRLLRPETVELGAACLARGAEPYVEETMAFGVGFQLQTDAARFGPATVAFGHTGTGGSVHGAWPVPNVGFSYLTNTLREARGADPRAIALLDALHDCVRHGTTR
jgi:CubicO group peptidase (beta-lactamase class C family)